MEDLTIEQVINEITIEAAGVAGRDGTDGSNGIDGINGKSAYEIAVDHGFTGDEAAWLASLVGADGVDGTNGSNGVDGKSAYELAVLGGFVGTQSQWLASLKGADGTNGTNGTNGTSATVTLGTVTTGAAGSQAQITNSGTSSNAIFNFVIPRGDTGASSATDPYDIGVQRDIFSAGTNGSATFSLSYFGFSSSSLNGQDYSALTSQYVAGKEKYYGPNKLSFKSGNNPTTTDSVGFALNPQYNIFNGFTVTYVCGLRTNGDSNMAAFWGFTDLFVGLPNALTIFSSSSDNSAFGFGWDANDTNVQFVIKLQGTTACYKLNLNQFTGNLTSTDILARQKEVPYIFRIIPKSDHTGLDLYFKNGNTGNIGTYSLLFSNVPNMPSIYTKYYKPAFIINQSSGKTPDNFDFFRLTSRTY